MIRYSLACADGHRFDSWFQSSAAYDDLAEKGLLSCAVCGTSSVEKCLMAPSVNTTKAKAPPPTEPALPAAPVPAAKPLSGPPHPTEAALRALQDKIEKEADYVGAGFVEEARSIQAGEADDRPIWGEAKLEEAQALLEDGVPVAPLPFAPRKALN